MIFELALDFRTPRKDTILCQEVSPELLYKWKRDLESDPKHAFPGKGKRKQEEDQVRKLEHELKRVTEERDILKKALAFFSKDV